MVCRRGSIASYATEPKDKKSPGRRDRKGSPVLGGAFRQVSSVAMPALLPRQLAEIPHPKPPLRHENFMRRGLKCGHAYSRGLRNLLAGHPHAHPVVAKLQPKVPDNVRSAERLVCKYHYSDFYTRLCHITFRRMTLTKLQISPDIRNPRKWRRHQKWRRLSSLRNKNSGVAQEVAEAFQPPYNCAHEHP